MVCDYRPLKDEPYRVRLTVGGDKLDYFGETASQTVNLLSYIETVDKKSGVKR